MIKNSFEIGQQVVYQSHGVGVIKNIETKTIEDQEISFYVIDLTTEELTLMVPVKKATAKVRHLKTNDEVNQAMDTFFQASKTTSKAIWSRRAEEYEKKINSGCLIQLSEVIRDLYKNIKNPDRSYSERMIYETALNRFVDEVALVKNTTTQKVEEQINEILVSDADLKAVSDTGAELDLEEYELEREDNINECDDEDGEGNRLVA